MLVYRQRKIPLPALLQDEFNQLGLWLEEMLVRSSGQSETSLQVSEDANLPLCSDQALAVLADSLAGASGLVESSFEIESTSGLLAFSTELIAWREQLFSRIAVLRRSGRDRSAGRELSC